MADLGDYLALLEEQLRQQQAAAAGGVFQTGDPKNWNITEPQAQVQQAFADLEIDPTGGDISRFVNEITTGGRTPQELRLLIAGQHQPAVVKNWLQDPAKREQFRALLRGDAEALQGFRQDLGGPSESGAQQARTFEGTLRELDSVPVPFVRPDLTVHRSEVDTPEKRAAWLREHGMTDPITAMLLDSALDYGGLSIEPTPFGTMSRPGRGLKWQRKSTAPGDLESAAITRNRRLTPAELSAIAGERQGNFRLYDPIGHWRQLARMVNTGIFATAGGLVAGPAIGGAAAGLGIPGTAATGFGAGMGGTGIAGGVGAVGGGAVGGGIGGGFGSGGDIDAILKGAAIGGASGGLNYMLPPATNAGFGSVRGAGIGAGSNLFGQAVGGQDIDWTQVAGAAGAGAAGGAFQGAGGTGNAGWDQVARFGSNLGTSGLKAFGRDPLAGVNAQLDQRELDAETRRQEALRAQQEEWKRRFAEASAAQREAMLAAKREWQQEYERRLAEYEAKRQAFMEARAAQIAEALRKMGESQPNIAQFMAERQAEIEAAQAQAQAERQRVMASRQFFPSQLLDAAPGQEPFLTSDALVSHSPPRLSFGPEGMPLSFASYGDPAQPAVSAEGFLPSGAGMPPAVQPLPTATRRRGPSLLNALARSPYLRV